MWSLKNLFRRLRRLFGLKRKLKGTWRVETAQELRPLYGLDAEQDIINHMAEDIKGSDNASQ